MARGMVAMGESREKYPEIVLTEEERRREELLKRLGQSFQKLMEARTTRAR